MTSEDRRRVYQAQNGAARLTGPQQRRLAKKAHKETDPTVGQHGRLRKRMDAKRNRELRRDGSTLVSFIRARRSGWRPSRRDAA